MQIFLSEILSSKVRNAFLKCVSAASFIVYFILLSSIPSCISQKKDAASIHHYIKGDPKYFFYNLTQEISRSAGFNLINNGFDSLIIRVWYFDNHVTDVKDIICKNGNWNAVNHLISKELLNGEVGNGGVKSKQVLPKSDWKQLVDSVKKLAVIDVPKMYKYSGASDAPFIVIEIAGKNSYQLDAYVLPIILHEFPKSDSITAFANYIEAQFKTGINRDPM